MTKDPARAVAIEQTYSGMRVDLHDNARYFLAGAEPLLVTQLGMVPDFAPRALIVAAAAAERAAERTPLLRRVCAHNVVLASKR